MPKCDFNKVALQLLFNFIEVALWHGCFPVNLLHIFRTPFSKDTPGQQLLLLSGIQGILKICDKHILQVSRTWCVMNILNKINIGHVFTGRSKRMLKNRLIYCSFLIGFTLSAFTCSKLTTETLEQGVEYIQNQQ